MACSLLGRGDEYIQSSSRKLDGKKLVGISRHVENLEQRGWVSMDWVHLPENRNTWWALVEAKLNFDELQGIL